MANAAVNPLSYGLALTGAVVWAVYCCVVKRISKRADATALFFIATSLALWMKYLLSDYSVVSVRPLALLELIGTATVMVLGYIGLDKGLSNGNLLFLAAVSYLAPVFFLVDEYSDSKHITAVIFLARSNLSDIWVTILLAGDSALKMLGNIFLVGCDLTELSC
jgi:drug/metabolite transporter (DMT)-like permease